MLGTCSGNQVTATVNLTDLKKPAEIVFVCDVAVQDNASAGDYLTKTEAYPTYVTKATYNGKLRHNEGANFTLCDGHAKYYKNNQGPLETDDWATTGNGYTWWRFANQK